jgi:hypothetical protein
MWLECPKVHPWRGRYMGPTPDLGHHLYLPHTPSKKPRLPEELHYRIVSQPVLGSRLIREPTRGLPN